jgi:putative membrane protein
MANEKKSRKEERKVAFMWIGWKDMRIAAVCGMLLGVPILLPAFELSKTDAQFMKKAAEASMTEAHLGQMAEAQSSQQSVKDFGQTLSKDHTSAYESLTELANKIGETIPKAIGPDRTIERLMHLKGTAFDRAFSRDEVQSHKGAIALFRNEAEHGENADVKAWAKAMLPTLEGHLQTAESISRVDMAHR